MKQGLHLLLPEKKISSDSPVAFLRIGERTSRSSVRTIHRKQRPSTSKNTVHHHTKSTTESL